MTNLAEYFNTALDESLEKQLNVVPSMLLVEERKFLYNYAHKIYTGKGTIIDAGPFLGGSTISFCRGLRDRNWPMAKTVDVFELFKTDPYMQDMGFNLPEPSFKSVFDKYLQDYKAYITVYAGDVMQSDWKPKPIELLFIDLAKSYEINQHIVKTFFPHLIPGVSVLIQQDFIHDWTPWLPITMDYFKDYFSYVTHSYLNSVIYKLEKPIPQGLIEAFDFKNYSFPEALKIYNKTIAPFEKTSQQKAMFAEGRKHLEMQIIHGEYYRGLPIPQKNRSLVERIIRKILRLFR